jgi:hypothetical protein
MLDLRELQFIGSDESIGSVTSDMYPTSFCVSFPAVYGSLLTYSLMRRKVVALAMMTLMILGVKSTTWKISHK